jgi:hypothetical protein
MEGREGGGVVSSSKRKQTSGLNHEQFTNFIY